MAVPADYQSQPAVQNLLAPAPAHPSAPRPQGEHQLPEVVPDSSPEAAPPRFYLEPGKYPVYIDDTPKLPTEQSPSAGFVSPGQPYGSPWGTASDQHGSELLSPNSTVPWKSLNEDQATYVGSEPPPQEKRICGLKRRTFGILAVVLGVIVLAAAIGGGVGGALSSKNDDSDPPYLNNSTEPEAFDRVQFQAFEEHNFLGRASDVIKQEGYYNFPFNLTSYVYLTDETDCCVTFCRDENTWGEAYWCSPRKREVVDDPWGFPRVSLWCGNRLDTERQRKCS